MKQKTVKALEKTRKKVSTIWEKRREKVKQIENRKISRWVKNKLIAKLNEKTYTNISESYKDYRNVKFVYEEKGNFENVRVEKYKELTNKSETVYKVKNENQSTKTVETIFKKNPKAIVLVIYKCLNDEGVIVYHSRSLTKKAFDELVERGETVENNLQEKAESSKSDIIMDFLQLYIKVYANVKHAKNKKKG